MRFEEMPSWDTGYWYQMPDGQYISLVTAEWSELEEIQTIRQETRVEGVGELKIDMGDKRLWIFPGKSSHANTLPDSDALSTYRNAILLEELIKGEWQRTTLYLA